MSLPPDSRSHGSLAPDDPVLAYAASKGLDLEILMSTAAGDRVLARELMTIFVQTAPQLHQRLALAIQCGDCPASQYESHALCGAAGLIGTIALVPILKEIEVLAFRRDHESVADQLPALALTFASVMAAVMLTLPHFDASGKATS